ncbi:hypothetical protein RD792_008154 [Penstemon davidsonii]|uniref:Hexosyltransferase n=1 Tax=Penstemon davidsonii TaxID=160366 RepID=A0ABR0D8A9_9LAMI|nr:hypothetical protein RD792_008154 [Penstemon davidsonii]
MTGNLKNIRNPEWFEVIAREIKNETVKIGLVNMDEIPNEIRTETKMLKIHFDHVEEHIRWSDLFPERIDEILPSKCPHIPMPRFQDYQELDVVIASVSHYECGVGGLRNIFRLQINLVVANLLVRSGRKDNAPLFVVFLGSCGPMWEIFRCDDLLWNEEDIWVYKPELKMIKQKVLMPMGSCQFVPPFSQLDTMSHLPQPKEAYVTILHSSEDYICGAMALAQSIIQSNSTKDLVLLIDNHISLQSQNHLRASGWKIKRIQRIRSPFSTNGSYNEWNYSKLRIWQLKEYDKVMFIDSDLIVKRNLDKFFIYPQLTAAGNYQKHFFNSGLMLVEPCKCTFDTLMKKRFVVESYNGGDQGFLNEMFSWWHRLPAKANYLKVFVDVNDRLHQIPDDVYAIHYTGAKPWTCRKEYDCNWDGDEFGRYASNSAHKRWWQVYNAMPKNLREYCALKTD